MKNGSTELDGLTGKIHSFQSMGTVDGPGVRFVTFIQGCNLRCGCCHNPDTWQFDQGNTFTPQQIVEKASRFREYFGKDGGITVSGGEPLAQAKFVTAVFKLAREQGINTCLDTSGSLLNQDVKTLLTQTDRVLLDIKYTQDELYKKHVGCSITATLKFLEYLNDNKIPTTIRQVIIPTLNDNEQNILRLKEIVSAHPCVDKVELLPFRKICQVKYDKLNLAFPFASIPEPTKEQMQELENLLNK